MISDTEARFYQENGDLVISNILDEITLVRLRGNVDEMVAASAVVTMYAWCMGRPPIRRVIRVAS